MTQHIQINGNIKVSAIVSVYKAERFIRGCLDDLIAQTFFQCGQLELIIVNSGSPENEDSIIKEYVSRYPACIAYLRTDERESIYQAWNRGIRIARGRYITNANTDDRHRYDALEVLASYLEADQQTALAYADVFVTNLPNQTFSKHIRSGYHLRPEYSPDIMLSGCHMGPQPMWRKDLHEKIGYFSEELQSAGDYEFWCRIALKYPLLHVPQFLGLYYENPTGFCNADNKLSANETIAVKQFYAQYFPPPSRSYTNNLQYRGETTPSQFVNIGMVTYNRLEFTKQAIDALVKRTAYPHVLTVIDNNSDDGTQEYLNELKSKGIITNLVLLDENIGVAKASNIAWNLEPDAEYYLKLDNDIVIAKPDWLSSMIRTMEAVPQLGALAYNFEPTSYQLHIINGLSIRLKSGNLGGACFLVSKQTRDKIGYWCEEYGLYGEEDFDYCFRMKQSKIAYAYMADENIGVHLPAGKAARINPLNFKSNDGIEEHKHLKYRQQKDDSRRRIIQSGLRDNNCRGYREGSHNLYINAEYFQSWNAADRQGLVPTLPQKNKLNSLRKIRIVVFSPDVRNNACSHYRIQAPFRVLAGLVELTWGIEFRDNTYHSVPGAAETADIIVVQRFFPRPETAEALAYLCSLNKPIILEIDDLITLLPSSNPHYHTGNQCMPYILESARQCTAVTVSTEELKRHFSTLNDTVYVLPNLLESTIWQKTAPSSTGPVIIGYAGTITHTTDLTLLEEVLERVAAEHKDRVAFTFMGCATEKISRLAGFTYITFETNFEAYARKLQETPFDIMLVPLEDNEFNRCKSNVKWLEYSACGIAGIYADLPPYNTCIRHGETGILVGNTPQQWFTAIDLLIKNPELRHSIAQKARQKVLSEYTLQDGAHRLLEAYREILDKHAAKRDLAPTSNRPAKVSIIIPLFNGAELTKACLAALERATEKSCYELILVDNGSSDSTIDLLQEWESKAVIIRNTENRGFAAACNQGARIARGNYLLFLNNDTEVKDHWLEPLTNILDNDSTVAAVGAKLLYPNGTIQHAGIMVVEDKAKGDPLVGRHHLSGIPGDHPAVNVMMRMQAVTAACILIRRTAFEAVGGFDEGYWNGYEDLDLCFKLGERNWKIVYQPASVVLHHESESGPERYLRAKNNIRRLHSRWLGKIKPDMVIMPDTRVVKGAGMLESIIGTYEHSIEKNTK